MAIQLGTSNQLMITIPSQGDLNWTSTFQNEFAQKIVEHDHTGSGSGAKIGASSLVDSTDVYLGKATEVAVQSRHIQDRAITSSKLSVSVENNISDNTSNIATNTSNISTNTSNIATNTSNIATNTSNIASIDSRLSTAESDLLTQSEIQNLINTSTSSFVSQSVLDNEISNVDSDISSLTSRVTSLESNPVQEIVITSQSEADALASIVENSFIKIAAVVTITGKTFKNCKISAENSPTLANCAVHSSEISATGTIVNIYFNQFIMYSSSLLGFNVAEFNNNIGTTSPSSLNRVSILTSYTNTKFQSTSSAYSLNISDCFIKGYAVELAGQNISVLYSEISPISSLTLKPDVDLGIIFGSKSVVKTQKISNASGYMNKVGINSTADMYCSDPDPYGIINITDVLGNTDIKVINSGGHSGFKIINGVATDFDAQATGTLKLLLADNNQLTPSAANTEDNVLSQFSTVGNRYNPNSLINASNQFIPTSSGLYIFNVTTSFATAISKRYLKIYVNGGTPVEFSSDSDGTVNTGDVLLNLTTSDAVTVTVETNGTDPVDYVYSIKQIV